MKQITWRGLNHVLTTLSEDELKKLIDEEVKNGKRVRFIERLHQRFCVVRTTRERIELLGGLE